MDRRQFVKQTGVLFGAVWASSCTGASVSAPEPVFKISLAQWAINQSFRDGTLDNLDFARVARENGYSAVEYVNQFFEDKANDTAYLTEMNRRADGEGITNVLIMIDGEGRIGDPDAATRTQAVENHFKWIEAAKFLNGHAVRVNAHGGPGTWEEQLDVMADGYGRVVAFGAEHGINVIIENHGGLSDDPRWLIELMERVNNPYAGVLPDTGGFSRWEGEEESVFDPYEALAMLMPYAKGVSIKSNTQLPSGERVQGDFERFMRIALDSGFRGYAGIESGGIDGIRAERERLEAAREALQPIYG